jgi:NitT/TauT family transport system ATP-binding protein
MHPSSEPDPEMSANADRTTAMPDFPAPALSLDAISCTFPGRDGVPTTAVREASVSVADGEFVSLVGPTGCGKSTLLNVAAGLLAPSAGEVSVFGHRLTGLNRRAGYLFQTDALLPWRTALDNVMLGLQLRGTPREESAARANDWLRRVGLAAHGGKYPHELSGGMRKRVALAQTLILDPKMLLMDEPFSALDVQTRSLMENELLGLWSQDRKSVLFVTHDLEEAISLSDRVVVLSAGPASRPIAEFAIDLPRPRDVAEIRLTPRFVELHTTIWQALREEVLKTYAQEESAA